MNSVMPAASIGALLAHDRFSSEQLGLSVYRLVEAARAREALNLLSDAPRPFMVEAKVPADTVTSVATLTALGFRVIDTGIQLDVHCRGLETRASHPAAAWCVRDAVPDDREAVERVSGDNLTTSRFHLDPQIDPGRASRLKRAWAGNFFDGRRGERLLVVETDHGVSGFLLVLEKGIEGIIDLVALDPELRGTGALDGLLRGWLERAPALTRLIVGTQVSNVSSLRAYGRLGFRVCGAAYVLHYHA